MRLRPTLIFTPYLTAVGAGMVALAMAVSGATVDEQTNSDLCMVI